MGYFLMVLLFFVSLFMMFIVLLQRGRGGGLAGALGGMGGQSVLGTKAGDVFTKITVVLAVIWVLLAGFGGMALRATPSKYVDDGVVSEADEAAAANAATPIKDADEKTTPPATTDSTTTNPVEGEAAAGGTDTADSSDSTDNADAGGTSEAEPAETTPEKSN